MIELERKVFVGFIWLNEKMFVVFFNMLYLVMEKSKGLFKFNDFEVGLVCGVVSDFFGVGDVISDGIGVIIFY